MIQAIEHIRRLRGGAQAHLMRANDGCSYVVKFVNNPQHRRVLANEWLASSLARHIGLSVPPISKLEVSAETIRKSPGLFQRTSGGGVRCLEGVQFGSRLPNADPDAPIYEHLPEAALRQVANLRQFAGMLAFDQWTCNCDRRQVVFCRRDGELWAYMIDHGFCFNAGEWTFPDNSFRGIYSPTCVYDNVTSWQAFEPWISQIEQIQESTIRVSASEIPIEWHGDPCSLQALVSKLTLRRTRVRELILAVKNLTQSPFRRWIA